MMSTRFFVTLVYTLVCAQLSVTGSPSYISHNAGVNKDIGESKINIEKVENVYIEMASAGVHYDNHLDKDLSHFKSIANDGKWIKNILNETHHYQFGKREYGDKHMGDANFDRHWDTEQDVPIYLTYAMANTRSQVTYVEVTIEHNGLAGHPEMVNGGIHRSNIQIKIPLHGTKFVHATATVYGKDGRTFSFN